MTPEERAAVVVQKLRNRRNSYTGELQDDITAAITEAEEAMREKCAVIADAEARTPAIDICCVETASNIAAAIRAR